MDNKLVNGLINPANADDNGPEIANTTTKESASFDSSEDNYYEPKENLNTESCDLNEEGLNALTDANGEKEPPDRKLVEKNKSAKKNIIFNILFKLTVVLPPLIVIPYLSRTLGPTALGNYEFALSITTYFCLFATLGVGFYGQREIAKYKGDKSKQTKVFCEIFLLRFIFVAITTIIDVFIVAFGVFGNNTNLMWINLIRLFAITFDLSYFFNGHENFAIFFVRNFIVRTLSLASIFLFVKGENDVLIYALIMGLEVLVANISIFPYLKKYVRRFFGKLNLKVHFVPILRLFIPTLAINLYTTFNKTTIGIIGMAEEVSYFAQGEKIINACLLLVTSITPVLVPRMVNAYHSNDTTSANQMLTKSFKFMFFLTVPLMFGIIAVSRLFVPFFFSESFNPTIQVLMIFPIALYPVCISNVIGIQYLIPANKDKEFTWSILLGVFVSMALSITFTIMWGFVGTTIAHVVTEIVVALAQMYYMRRDFSPIKIIKFSLKYLLVGAVMFAAVFISSYFLKPDAIGILILVSEGVMVYTIGMLLAKDENMREIILLIKKIIKKSKGPVN
ncbi:MAG: flippase [Christensenellaceae bacterium]|jgi:O-antigen/teichoic acid export membrane protein|nr:flippase [Christensenellaceae bacterium]